MSSFRIRHVGYKPHRHPQNAIMCAAFTFLFAAFGSFATLLLVLPMDGHLVPALNLIAAWRALDMSHMSAPLYLHTGLAVLVATVAAGCAFSLALAETPLEEPFRSINDADPKLYYDEFARDDLSRRLTEEAGSGDKAGLWLAPHLPLPFSLDTRATFREGVYAGNDIPLVSHWSGNLGLTWDIYHKFAVFDAVVRYVGERRMDNDQANFQPMIPAHTTLDLRLGGEMKNLFWSLSVQNLFNVLYFDYAVASSATYGRYNAYPLAGRTYMVKVGATF